MNTKNTMQERVSTFVDGEMDDCQGDSLLAALKTPEGRQLWTDYHQIGDVLRSDDMDMPMSTDFTSRLMQRLESEPTIIAPRPVEQSIIPDAVVTVHPATRTAKRFSWQGMAAAVAVVALTASIVPQILPESGEVSGEPVVASVPQTLPAPVASSAPATVQPAAVPVALEVAEPLPENQELLRDAGIDEYLMAHQRFSPSLHSTAQYARSATFAVEADK